VNLTAFLTTIATSEGTEQEPDPYRVCFGKLHTIIDLTYHPAEHRPSGPPEWSGEQLPDHLCENVGLKPPCWSTAAGRYQIIRPTWLRLKGLLKLSNFAAPAQDDGAIQLIKERGALELVNAGQFEDAILKCHPEWASLPGSTAGQPQTKLADLMGFYADAGGSFA
jgi:lysozyme